MQLHHVAAPANGRVTMFVDRLIGLASPAAALRRAITLIEQERGAEAFPLLTRAAKAGIPQAELGFARSLGRRSGNEDTLRQVAEQLQRAADAGLPTANYLFAIVTESGAGVPPDPARAAEYCKRAAEKGHRAAQVKWGVAL